MGLTHMQIKELLDENACHECEGVGPDHVCVKIAAIAELPSRFGQFHIVAFYNNKDDKEHVAIVHGDVSDAEDVPVRVHSECLTGDVLGSLRCDCRDQLESALRMIGQMERGIAALHAPGGTRHRADQQDPRLRPAGTRLRHGRGQPRPRLPRRRARVQRGGAHARVPARQLHPV